MRSPVCGSVPPAEPDTSSPALSSAAPSPARSVCAAPEGPLQAGCNRPAPSRSTETIHGRRIFHPYTHRDRKIFRGSTFQNRSQAEEILKDNEVGSLASDPDKVGDIIVYVKGLFDSNQITDDEISQGIDEAADHFGVSLNEDDKSSLVNIISKFRGIEMSDDQIKGYVSDAYSTLKDMGVTKSDVKNIFEKAVEFIKGMLSRR